MISGLVKSRFPKMSEALLKRLVISIEHRRNRLISKYYQRHGGQSDLLQGKPQQHGALGSQYVTINSSFSLRPTTFSNVSNSSSSNSDDADSSTPSTTYAEDMQYPDPPLAKDRTGVCVCDWCSDELDVAELSKSAWRYVHGTLPTYQNAES
jgi:hypothetical protein